MHDYDFKDPYLEKRIFRRRAVLFWVFLALLLGLLAGRMLYLQLLQHDHYVTASDSNRMLVQPISPNRGLIYDNKGVLLAGNKASYSLDIIPEQVDDFATLIADIKSIIPINDSEIEDYLIRVKQRRRSYESVPLKFSLTEKQMAQISVNAHRLLGVSIKTQTIRYYPLKASTAHSVGYVGRINKQELQQLNATSYSGTSHIGKTGVEKFYESDLIGKPGWQKVEINAHGRVLKVLERQASTSGANITLWLDSELQRTAEQELGDRRGAVVVIDTTTGGILALVSKPNYDPNLFVSGISIHDYAQLRDSPDLPLFNRALRGQYPPGSTIKPFVGLAALELNVTNWHYNVYDPGWYKINKNGRFYRDWKKYGHGRVNLEKAITQSCDTYFYNIAHNFDIDKVHDFLAQFGLGKQTALDVNYAKKGILPSTQWKKNKIGESWYAGDSLNFSIGQGYMLSTPLQLATATMVLANRGKWVQPKLLKSMSKREELDEPNLMPRELKPLDDVILADTSNWEKMILAMESVMSGKRGTAKKAGKGLTYRMAGKTGTAQVVGIKQNEEYDASTMAEKNKDHALFIAFAPIDAPKVAIAVIVENGGGGGSTAAPIARKVLDAWLGVNDK